MESNEILLHVWEQWNPAHTPCPKAFASIINDRQMAFAPGMAPLHDVQANTYTHNTYIRLLSWVLQLNIISSERALQFA